MCYNNTIAKLFSKFFSLCVCLVIGEPLSLDWYNPQGERMVPSQRVALHNEGVRSRLTLYNAKIEDAGIYRCQANDAQGHTQEATVVLEIYREYQTLTNKSAHTHLLLSSWSL